MLSRFHAVKYYSKRVGLQTVILCATFGWWSREGQEAKVYREALIVYHLIMLRRTLSLAWNVARVWGSTRTHTVLIQSYEKS